MPKKVDITENSDDQELNTGFDDTSDDDDDEDDDDDSPDATSGVDDDDEPKAKRAPRNRQDITAIRRDIADLTKQLTAVGTRSETAKAKKLDTLLTNLSASGWNKDQVAVLAAVAEATRLDLKDEHEEEKRKDRSQSLAEGCEEELDREIEKWAKRHPSVGWAAETIKKKAAQLMGKSSAFEEARNRFNSGKKPSQKDFEKSVGRIVETYLKDSGIKGGGNSEQLDVKSSRTKPAPAISKDGEVDESKLNDFELEVYKTTLNVTKNKELALDALKAARGRR